VAFIPSFCRLAVEGGQKRLDALPLSMQKKPRRTRTLILPTSLVKWESYFCIFMLAGGAG